MIGPRSDKNNGLTHFEQFKTRLPDLPNKNINLSTWINNESVDFFWLNYKSGIYFCILTNCERFVSVCFLQAHPMAMIACGKIFFVGSTATQAAASLQFKTNVPPKLQRELSKYIKGWTCSLTLLSRIKVAEDNNCSIIRCDKIDTTNIYLQGLLVKMTL